MAATLADIRTKVRRLTRSPSASQLSDIQIDEYINTFLLYDLPEHERLFTFRKTLTFYTEPNVDVYDTNTVRDTDPLYDFKNAFITSHAPVYVAGYKAYLTLSRNDFFNIYPQLQVQRKIGTGNGIITNFIGVLGVKPILQNQVLFSSIDADHKSLVLTDTPVKFPATGVRTSLGDLKWPNDPVARGAIDYISGDYLFDFPVAPGVGEAIYAQTVGYQAARPCAVLYYDNAFTVRPVPDKTYAINIEAYIKPTALVNAGDEPILQQHWQLLAYGGARKILQDRLDIDTLALLEPEFKEQMLLVGRRTIVQQSEERTATIYTQMVDPSSNNWNNFI